MRTRNICQFFIFLLTFFFSLSGFSQSTVKKKNAKTNALYIYNLTKYVQWSNIGQLNEFRIGIVGDENDLIAQLNILAGKKQVKGLPIRILSFKSASTIEACEVIYVDARNNSGVNLNKLLKKNTLLVTENNQSFDNTMISFFTENGWQKLAVNQKNITAQGLKVADDLLSLAIVNSTEWKTTFEKFKYILSHDSSGLNISKKDLVEVIKTQENQLNQIGLQQKDIEEKIALLKTKEDQIKLQEEMADSLNSEIALKKQSLEKTMSAINAQKETLDTQKAEIDNQAAILKKQKIVITVFVTLCILILMLAIQTYRSFRVKKKQNILLETQKSEITEQKKIIEVKNHEIVDSINYAKKIQLAVLPDIDEFTSKFYSAFVLYKPKDIVSGDFFWMYQMEETIFYATADCTGHGVPGGFMSMLSSSFLNEIVIEKEIYEPGDVLDMLRLKIIKALKQQGKMGEQQDGLDISFCKLDKKTMKLTYAAANNPVFLVRKGELQEFPCTSQPVGISHSPAIQFEQRTIELTRDDIVYTFTDGYADQFGGPKGKKFMSKRFKETLLGISALPTEKQKEKLDQQFTEWQGEHEQVDDVLVIGVKV